MKTLYFDCVAGASGDMLLGALLDLGLPLAYLKQELNKLQLPHWELTAEKSTEKGISVTRCNVGVTQPQHQHRHLKDIVTLIDHSDLNESVKTNSKKMFQRLAEAEATVHNQPIEGVHFHEVGAIDSIIDIIGCNIGFDYFQIDNFAASILPVGWGTVHCEHGILPVPAPATTILLKNVPITPGLNEGEVLTPTGALVITSMTQQFGPMPNMSIQQVGYGAGTKALNQPNILRLILGQSNLSPTNIDIDEITVIEASIDDQNPEFYNFLTEILLSAGALDIAIISCIMKKGRPGNLVKVLCPPELTISISNLILTHTSSIGLRYYPAQRYKLPRVLKQVETSYGPVTIKISGFSGDQLKTSGNLAPEYEDCVNIARAHNIPLKMVYQAALSKAWSQFSEISLDELSIDL